MKDTSLPKLAAVVRQLEILRFLREKQMTFETRGCQRRIAEHFKISNAQACRDVQVILRMVSHGATCPICKKRLFGAEGRA